MMVDGGDGDVVQKIKLNFLLACLRYRSRRSCSFLWVWIRPGWWTCTACKMVMMMVMMVMMMITLPELMMIVTLTWLLFHTRARPRSHWTIPPLDFISNQLPPPAVHSAWIKKPPRVKKPGTKRSGPAEGVGTLYMLRLYKCADTICQLCLYCQSFHRCWHQNTILLNWCLTWNFRDTWVSN